MNVQAQTPYYHINRSFTPVDCYIAGTPTVADLYAESEELTETVAGTIQLNTNGPPDGTYAIEKQMAITVCYDYPEIAWMAAVDYNNGTPSNYPGKIFDNVGWVVGTKNTGSGWGAYLWVLQNRIVFQSSTSDWWTATNGLPIAITNVMVGTLGDYQAMSNVVDIGPSLDGVTNRYLGPNNSDDQVYQVDITNVFYQLSIPDIWITPRFAVTNVGGTNIQYTVTGTNIPQGVTWKIIPEGVGATIQTNADWYHAEVTPGNVGTNYKVRATSKDNTNFYDEVNLKVVKVDILESNVYVAVNNTVTLHLTADSTADTQWQIIPSVQNGASIEGSSVGTSVVINAGSIPTNYMVKAYAVNYTNCYDTCTVTILKMELNWEAMDSALDDNPNWNGGKRIFPDRQSPADTTARDKVRLRAKLTPALPNIPLYFKAFDVDDPTPASIDPAEVIDANGQSGNDNRGSPQAGGLSATLGTTDNNGEVVVEFTVMKQPGDNFRVAVALNEAELNKLTITDPNSSFYVRPDNSAPGNFWGGVSPMLTVWRRLWLEFDSLETWPSTGDEKNFETGLITGIQSNTPAAGQSTLQLDMLLLDEEDRYEGGYIQIAGVGQFTVSKNSDNLLFDDTVVIQGIPAQNVVGQTFTIYDDDNVQMGSRPPRTMPYLLSGGLLINTAFADAYIKPEPVPSTYIDNDVPFNRNMVGGIGYYFDWLPTVNYGRDLNESQDFWYSYLLAAFQPEVSEDDDPDSLEHVTYGAADHGILPENRSAIYVETIREVESRPNAPRIKEEHVVVHEIGHQGGGDHEDKGIMDDGAPVNEDKFKDVTIKKFRDNITF